MEKKLEASVLIFIVFLAFYKSNKSFLDANDGHSANPYWFHNGNHVRNHCKRPCMMVVVTKSDLAKRALGPEWHDLFNRMRAHNDKQGAALKWTRQTHAQFPLVVRRNVVLALWVFAQLLPRLPKDVVNLIFDVCFSQQRQDVVFCSARSGGGLKELKDELLNLVAQNRQVDDKKNLEVVVPTTKQKNTKCVVS